MQNIFKECSERGAKIATYDLEKESSGFTLFLKGFGPVGWHTGSKKLFESMGESFRELLDKKGKTLENIDYKKINPPKSNSDVLRGKILNPDDDTYSRTDYETYLEEWGLEVEI